MAMQSSSAWTITALEVDGVKTKATVVCHVDPRGEQEGGDVSISIEFIPTHQSVSDEALRAEVVERVREIARRSLFLA